MSTQAKSSTIRSKYPRRRRRRAQQDPRAGRHRVRRPRRLLELDHDLLQGAARAAARRARTSASSTSSNRASGGFFRLDKDQQSGFLVVNTVGDTSKPEASSPANDVREETLIAHVRHSAGVDDLPVTITGVARWRATSDVARRFRVGPCLSGGRRRAPDAAQRRVRRQHRHPRRPQPRVEARARAEGRGRRRLLDTYDAERSPRRRSRSSRRTRDT